jgi:hypothetical protein
MGDEEKEIRLKDARRFYDTFKTQVDLADSEWINRVKDKGNDATVYSLGIGASIVETEAMRYLFPEATKVGVDIDETGEFLAKRFGFKFVNKSADDENIYNIEGRDLKPDLVIIRNLKPAEDSKMWPDAIKLAWDKMLPGGILYMTASSAEREIDSQIVSRALGIEQAEIEKKWVVNLNTLKEGGFPDHIVLTLQKGQGQL